MAELLFYNSLTRQAESFTPTDPGKVRLYHCGPTVYARQHIGNLRRFLFADTLRRTLELFGYEVREITNITDVGHLTQDEIDAGEDKLEKAARETKATPQSIAEAQTALFFDDIAALNIQPSHKYPRATGHIAEMQALIQKLLDTKHAYQTASGVYFDVQSFPEYGKLSGNTLEQLAAGARVAVREDKHHPADFALWIVSDASLQQWDSPWGKGFPGWHIECSAMALTYLGSGIDIHTGGEDNRFPHHENEIAQSEAAGNTPFVRFWLHNRHLQLEGKKLAKREGEQITLATIRERGFDPVDFRWLVLNAHYRTRLDFSWESLKAAHEQIAGLRSLLRRLREFPAKTEGSNAEPDGAAVKEFQEALGQDLNTPVAVAVVLAYVRQANSQLEQRPTATMVMTLRATLEVFDRVLGIFSMLETALAHETVPAAVRRLAEQREEARRGRDFARADTLRAEIEQEGYRVEDTSHGPRLIAA